MKWPHAGTGQIVFENGGQLYRLDPKAPEPRKITVSLSDDRRLARPRYVSVKDRITSFSLSPGGQRVAFTARGDVFTVPAEHGNTRNITESQGVREKDAAWSPDGKWIAYTSDQTGEEEVYVAAQDGKGTPTQLTSGSASFHLPLVWSPDSKKLAWADRSQRLHVVEVATQKPVEVDRGALQEITQYVFSPDSEWLAYTKRTDNGQTAIFLYGLAKKAITMATEADGSNDPAFDPDGKYLFFLSEREINPTLGSFELSYTVNRTSRPQALVLRADLPSPFAPRSDEAKPVDPKEEEKKKEEAKKKEPFRIDLEGLRRRVVPFPVAGGQLHRGLRGQRQGLLAVRARFHPDRRRGPQGLAARLRPGEAQGGGGGGRPPGLRPLPRPREGPRSSTGPTTPSSSPRRTRPSTRHLDLSGLRMELDPRAEWAQIFQDAWRIERDFFYLPDMGKIDWPAMRKRYEALLPWVSHRIDLTLLLGELAGELGSGHSYVGGGDLPQVEKMPVGVLGAELRLDAKAKAFRIDRIYPGESWTEERRSPLRGPGGRRSKRASTSWPSTARTWAPTTSPTGCSRARPTAR